MGELPLAALTSAAGVVVAVLAFLLGRKSGRQVEIGEQRRAKATAEETAGRVLEEARREAETLRKGAVVAGKEEILHLRESLDQEVRSRRLEVEREEKRVVERESQLDRARESLEGREQELQRRGREFGTREQATAAREQELERLIADERRKLEQLAGLSAEQAKSELVRRLEDEALADAASRLREIRESAKRNAEREAKKIVALAVQRVAAETTAETTVSAVSLPNDEMKGRIIGREGRNIRAFELATGVDVIIDDTPDTVVVSCFDPVRRETARLALEKLVSDGRIHPGRIEE
ncbi:MAG: Rnase Y domain-containing protein, partial [Gemmatimonadaceae bacterium]